MDSGFVFMLEPSLVNKAWPTELDKTTYSLCKYIYIYNFYVNL